MNDEPQAATEMPLYRSHKQVRALEIASCTINGEAPPPPDTPNDEVRPHPGFTLTFSDAAYAPKKVQPNVVHRYFPQPGDFLVVYSDGYESISPRAPFIDGYTKV